MSEARYWIRLGLSCLIGGFLLFYLSLNLAVKGGKVTMPDLRGAGRGAAEARLRGLGLKMAVREERFSTDRPFGAVLEQDIEPGAVIKSGRTVELILSRGTKVVDVPELRGLANARQARLLLEGNGLALGLEEAVPSAAPKDSVLAHSPEAGVEVARGAAVSLLISLGPSPAALVMPDFKGIAVGKAREAAQLMGLVVRRVLEKPSASAAPGTVLAQSLSAGARVDEGSELALTASPGSADQGGGARLVEIEYTVPEEGVTERRVVITLSDESGVHAVYNRMVKPGDTAKVTARARGAASYKVALSGVDVETKELP